VHEKQRFELLPDIEILCNFSMCVLLAGGSVAFEYFSDAKHTFNLQVKPVNDILYNVSINRCNKLINTYIHLIRR